MTLLSSINFLLILAVTSLACWFLYRRLVKRDVEKHKALLFTGVPFALFGLLILLVL